MNQSLINRNTRNEIHFKEINRHLDPFTCQILGRNSTRYASVFKVTDFFCRSVWQNFDYFQQNSLKHWQLSVNWICPGHFPDILSQKLNNTIILLAQRYKSNSWLYNFLGLESVLQCSILNCQKSFLKFTFVDYQAFSSFCWRNIATLISWVHFQCYFSAWNYFSIFRQRILHQHWLEFGLSYLISLRIILDACLFSQRSTNSYCHNFIFTYSEMINRPIFMTLL